MRGIIPGAVALVLSVAAQPAAAQDGTTISKDNVCGGFVPTADGGLSSNYLSTTDTMIVTKAGSTTTLSCHFIIPSEMIPANTTRASGFACFTFLGLTYDTRMQANSGGNATLSCRVRSR
jgi:hypothetical protein